MTTQPDMFPTNYAVIVGRLGSFTSPGYGSAKSHKPQKTISKRGDFGRTTQFVVSLETPFGEPFYLLMDAGSNTRGMAVLEAANIGDFVVVEGALMLETEADRRYAQNDEDDGRRARDLMVRVMTIRAPTEDEQQSEAHVWLEGTIVEPATFVRHEKIRSAQFGRTIIRTTFGPHRIPCDVACLVSSEHESAGYVYRAGNKLRLRGNITRLMTTQYGESVAQAVERLQAQWHEDKKTLDRKPVEEQRKALSRYRSRRAALLNQARTFVLVSEVLPLSNAEAITFEQARGERREFAKRARRSGVQGARELAQQHPAPQGVGEV